MSNSNSPSHAKRALRLTAQRKFELYLATRPADAVSGGDISTQNRGLKSPLNRA